jgi:predicted enzyme related to lactoylglutathione lyase
MKIEHVGFLVEKPVSMGNWWVANLGFNIVRQSGNDEEGVTFVKDNADTIIEFGKMKSEKSFNFTDTTPLQVHIAIDCENPELEAKRLVKAGAGPVEDPEKYNRTGEIVLVRDPFGAVIQLINRKNKFE